MQATVTGMNRTGAALSPIGVKAMTQAADALTPAVPIDTAAMDAERLTYINDADAVGSIPPPASLKGVAQHITHYGCMINPEESLLEKLLICEATEIWNYTACMEQETHPRIKAMWEQFLDYELGQFQVALQLFKDVERRDPAEVLGDGSLPPGIRFESQRDFVRKVLETEVQLRKDGTEFVDEAQEPQSSQEYRKVVNADGCPSENVSATYHWTPGTELMRMPGASDVAH